MTELSTSDEKSTGKLEIHRSFINNESNIIQLGVTKNWRLLRFISKKRPRSLNENNPWKQKHSVLKGSFKNVQSLYCLSISRLKEQQYQSTEW